MIASLRGAVATAGLDHVVLEVGGVGMLVHVTPGTASGLRRGQEARLATSLVVREDSLTLFGFADEAERDLFEQVQTVSGVGPRLALAMLAVHPPDSLRAAISGGDVVALTKVPGIGKKGAERIVLELRDKVGAIPGGAATVVAAGNGSPARGQVAEALVGLGWSAKQADDAVGKVLAAGPQSGDVSSLLRLALRELGR
ncbi:Holliday junction branch migration protein RuvA [Luteipulveratus flavus]|uniref:Holliday junction branch migration complex subunit RuvA n=1 Tax=Luteipulveratus flavus TaxID=3031728 RepID=A0ABT6CBX5_9MICO|nr:Holliday junction branch migration protein RuvA [Luteipulveratus sp. YIM 133296]MDF8266290.1 Holliday junction branch migration protein RuvA [Luteipulveratus sp. YIM 133296]